MTASGERGAVMVEFALVSLVLSLLLAVSIDFGRLMFSAQALQDVARVAARELSVTPLAAAMTFEEALDDPTVQLRVYDRTRLVVNLDDPSTDTDEEIDAYFATLPVVNRALRPLMIVDERTATHPRVLRYPGALLSDPAAPGSFTVGIPRVTARDPETGVETIEWLPVVEEIRADPCDAGSGAFSLVGPVAAGQRGLVALRINYPYQAAGMSGFQPSADGPFEPNVGNPITADDSAGAVGEEPAPPGCPAREPPGTPLGDDPDAVGAYVGPFGLGRQLAFARKVRPFRKLLSAQAIYRREVFQ